MSSFDDQLNAHRDAVYRQMLRICGNHDDAEDVLVESLLLAWRASHGLRNTESVQAWLVQIGRRTCFRLQKKRSKLLLVGLEELQELGVEIPNRDPSPLEQAEELRFKDCVLDALAKLPANWRTAYQMVELEGKSITDVAKALDTSPTNIKVRVHRARTRLRQEFDQLFPS